MKLPQSVAGRGGDGAACHVHSEHLVRPHARVTFSIGGRSGCSQAKRSNRAIDLAVEIPNEWFVKCMPLPWTGRMELMVGNMEQQG
eukprot:61873-Amphidinium_carterae.1